MTVTRAPFGRLPDGTDIERVTLATPNGITVAILTYGGIIAAIDVPARDGTLANIVLGYATLREYLEGSGTYFGAIIGRFANRIARGRFAIGDRRYELATNNDLNALHGGVVGFDKRAWHVTRATADDRAAVLALELESPDGDQGYPGALHASVTYALERDALRITYAATTDRETIVNLTNHSYFNLAGEASGNVEDQELTIFASRYTPVDETMIPTGELVPVDGTPFDFRTPTRIGARLRANDAQLRAARGYDHNWVLDREPGESLTLAMSGYDPASGRCLDILTTEAGVQVYTGNLLTSSEAGTGGAIYRQTSGWTAETQAFPDSPNQPHFPSTLLRPGETYASETVFRFSTDATVAR